MVRQIWHVKGYTCWCASCWHPVFVLLFSLFWFIFKFNFVWLCQRLESLFFKKTTVHINLLEYFFLAIDVCTYDPLSLSNCWLCSLTDILAPHESNINSHALSLLTISYVVYAAMVQIWHCFISWRNLVWHLANTITLQVVWLLCYCEKDNLCSLLNSGRQLFYWSKLTMSSPQVLP